MARLVWTDGKMYEVPDDKVRQALADGFVQPSQEQVARSEESGKSGQAFLEGVGRGLTAGAADKKYVMDELEVEREKAGVPFFKLTPDNIKERAKKNVLYRKEESPIASGGGELLGMVAPAVFTGGSTAAATTGVKATAGRVVGSATFQSGVYGAGQVYSESVLENKPLHAENLAAGFAGGALTGAGLGLLGTGLKKGVSIGTKALGGEALAKKLEGLGKEAKWLNLGGQNRKLLENEGLKDDILKLADDLKVKEFSLAEADKVAKYKGTELSKRYDDFLGKLDEKLPVVDSNFARRNSVTLASDLTRDLKQAFKGDAHLAEEIAQLEDKLTRGAGEWGKWRNVHNFYKSLKGGSGTPEGFLKKRLGTELEAIAGEINPGLGAQFKKLNKDYKAASELEDAITRRATGLDAQGSAVAQGVRGATWAAGAGFLGMGAPGIVAAGLSPFAKEFAARKGGFIVGNVLDSLGPATAKMAKGLAQRINVVASSGLLGKFALPLTNAAALGTNELLAEYTRIASGPEGGQLMSLLGVSPESPDELKQLGERMSVLESIENNTNEYQKNLGKAADGFFNSKPGARAAKPVSREDFDKSVGHLKQLVADPQKMFDAMPGEFLGIAPETTGMTAAKLLGAANYLYDKAPKSPWADKPPALQQHWAPSESAKAKWWRYVEAVTDPNVVVEKLGDGTVTREHIEAVQAIYPQIYQKLQQELSDRLMAWKGPLSWEKRRTLAQVLGPEVLSSKQQVSTMQTIHAKNREGQQPGGGAGGKADGRQGVDAEKNQQTQGQRMEAR